MKAIIWKVGVVLAVVIPLVSTVWFNNTYVGWMIESVPNSLAFKNQWQGLIDEQTEITHPAVMHWLPNNCLCRVLTMNHAAQITQSALQNGFSVFQLNTADQGLGTSVELLSSPELAMGPLILITRKNGQIAYVGAYSDGVRCNTGSSMVETFIESPDTLPSLPVVGIDVKTCRCLNN